MIPRQPAALALLLAACGGDGPRPVPEVAFAAPPDTLVIRWVHIPAGAWLGGTRWTVVSEEFGEAWIVDFATGARRRLGGRGEAEVRQPFGVFGLDDTAYVADWALRRLTRWSAEGRFAGRTDAPADLKGALPAARDRAGRYYFEARPNPGPDGSGLRDSGAVVRAAPDLTRFDTLARLAPLDLALVEDARGRRFERRVFSGTDKWGALPDGTVWVARVYHNRVLWLEPSGRAVLGPALPDQVIEVSGVDRDHFVLRFPEELRATAERLPFSPLHPPFVGALPVPSGGLWLEKSRPAMDTLFQRYQVIDPAGRLSHLVLVPGRTGRVIALGDGMALLAEQFLDGVRLMQARVPEPPDRDE